MHIKLKIILFFYHIKKMNSSNKSNEEQAKTSKVKCVFENLKTDYFFQRLFSWIIKKKISPNI